MYSLVQRSSMAWSRSDLQALGVQAGGLGSTGKERVLDVCPEKVHQRVPLFIGSKGEVEYAESFLKRESA